MPGMAVPMTYTAGGRQYVVIAAGGNAQVGTKIGDYLIAFALPADARRRQRLRATARLSGRGILPGCVPSLQIQHRMLIVQG